MRTRKSNAEDLDIIALARQARALGYADIDSVVMRLKEVIIRNGNYLDYRARKGFRGPYNDLVNEDSMVLAMAIVLLESTTPEYQEEI